MFEIKFVVRDKHLADVLNSLDGVAVEPPVVIPVHESFAKPIKGHVTTTTSVGDTRAELTTRSAAILRMQEKRAAGRPKMQDVVKEWLDKNPKVVRFVPETITPFLLERGFAKGSTAYAVSVMQKMGRLKAKGGKGNYEVVKK